MIDELKLLAGEDVEVSPNIIIHHPKLSEIKDMGEENYYSLVSLICATPSDYKSILFDTFKIDYEEVKEFDFFVWLWMGLGDEDVSIIFPGCKASDFERKVDEKSGLMYLLNKKTGGFINEVVYATMTDYIRKFHGFEKHTDIAGNETTKRYLIKKARRELERRKNEDKGGPVLASLVSAMVNCEQFKYNHFTVWNLTIYQFMDSVRRIQKLKNSDQVLTEIYTGNIDSKKISQDSYNWMGTLE